MTKYAFVLIPGIIACYFLFFPLINLFERLFLGPLEYEKRRYIWEVIRKWPIYVLLPLLFIFTGTYFFLIPNPSFQQALETNNIQESSPQATPYGENQIEKLEFPSMKKNLMWAILAVILIVSLTRITAFTYHTFLVRTLLYSGLLMIGFFFMMYFINPRFHEVFIDNVLRPNWNECIALIILTGTIGVFLVEGLLVGFFPRIGFYTASYVVPAGVYVCKHCLRTVFLPQDGVLSRCTQCKREDFRREK